MKQNTSPALLIGIIGLIIVICLNLLGLYYFNKPAAEFFSDGWWSSWFPVYIAWIALTTIGLVRKDKTGRSSN